MTGAGFQGIDDTQCGCDPPDIQDAVGPYEVVEMVNLYVEVWDHNGTALAGQSLNSFYSSSSQMSDPRIIYDNLSGRFFASITVISGSSGSIYFAVSDNASAAGGWTVYKILSSGSASLADQPMLGVNSTLIGFGANIFSGSFSGAAEYWVVNKTEVLLGATTSYAAFGPDSSSFSIHPARILDSNAPLYFVESYGGSPGTLELFRIHGIPPGATTVSTTNLTVGNIAVPPPAPTPDGGFVDTSIYRIADAVGQAGKLYVTFGDQCKVAGSDRACVRLTVLNTTPSISVDQDFDIALAGTYLYYPALSLDGAGDVDLVFGLSSSSLDPSLAAVTHRASDPGTTISPFVWIHQGSAGRPSSCSPSCRFGDYFGSGADPNGSEVWVSGEYLTSSALWQSWLAPVRSVGPTLAALSSPAGADAGTPFHLALDVYNAPCAPGSGTYCTARIPWPNSTAANLPCGTIGGTIQIPAFFALPGNYTIGTGGSVSSFNTSSCSTPMAVYPLHPTTVQVFGAFSVSMADNNGGSGDVGESIQFYTVGGGGAPPINYSWSGLPTGCLPANVPVLVCTPSGPGIFIVELNATDAAGVSFLRFDQFTVHPAPLAVASVSQPEADVGMQVTFTGSASGGSGQYRYSWVGLPAGCVSLNATAELCTLEAVGVYSVVLVVNDSEGISGTSPTIELTVDPAITLQLALSPSFPSPGETVSFAVETSGGVAPYTYGWSGLPSDCVQATTPNASCAFPSGTFRVTVTVHDAVGGSATANQTLIVPAPSSPRNGLSTQWILAAGGLVAVVLVALAALVLWRRRTPPKGRASTGAR